VFACLLRLKTLTRIAFFSQNEKLSTSGPSVAVVVGENGGTTGTTGTTTGMTTETGTSSSHSLHSSQTNVASPDQASTTVLPEPVSRPIEDLVTEIGIKLKVPQPGCVTKETILSVSRLWMFLLNDNLAIEDVTRKLKSGWFYTEDSLLSCNLDKIVDLQLPTKLLEELKERQKLWK